MTRSRLSLWYRPSSNARAHAPRVRLWHVAALALLAATAACRHDPEVQPDLPTQPDLPARDVQVPHVQTVLAESAEVPRQLDLTGTLVGAQQSDVTALVAGRVSEVLVERGAHVKKGAPMIRLRADEYATQARSARAALAQARARLGLQADAGPQGFDPDRVPDVVAAHAALERAEGELKRGESLIATGAISEQAFENARTQADATRAQHEAARNQARAFYATLAQARANADQADRAVADAVVRAPFDGEIAARHVNVGEYVNPQKPVVTLVETKALRVEVSVPQEYVPQVRVGQALSLEVDAYPQRSFRGEVRYVSAALSPTSRLLSVEAVVPNGDQSLRPGFFARTRLELPETDALVRVPASALVGSPGRQHAFVVDGSVVRERLVVVARADGDSVLLSQGVRPDESVAIDHVETLADGVRVVTD